MCIDLLVLLFGTILVAVPATGFVLIPVTSKMLQQAWRNDLNDLEAMTNGASN